MIPDQWYAVLESNEVPKGKVVGVTRMGEKLVFGAMHRARCRACLISARIAGLRSARARCSATTCNARSTASSSIRPGAVR